MPAVRTKIQQWLDRQNIYPPCGSAEEYATYIEKCYPIPEDRHAFFQEKVRQVVPHTGYRLVIKLAEAGLTESVWTPNFDGLMPKTAAQSRVITAVEIGIGCQERLPRAPKRHELLCVSMYGDYRMTAWNKDCDPLSSGGCLEGRASEEARQLMMSQVRVPTEQRMDFAFENLPTCGLIKSNAFPLTPPGETYEFDLKNWPEEKGLGLFR